MNANIQVVKKGRETAIEGKKGETLLAVLVKNGFAVKHPCGGKGKCGKCLVRVTDTTSKPGKTETELLGKKKFAAGYRVACLVRSDQSMTVLLDGPQKELQAKETEHVLFEPKLSVETLLEKKVVAQGDVLVTEVFRHGQLIGLEEGDTTDHAYGIAIAIEGKRVYAALCHLHTGDTVARLETAKRETIKQLLAEATEKLFAVAGVSIQWLYDVTILTDQAFWGKLLQELGQAEKSKTSEQLYIPLANFVSDAALGAYMTAFASPVGCSGFAAVLSAYHLMDLKQTCVILLQDGQFAIHRKGQLYVNHASLTPMNFLAQLKMPFAEPVTIAVDTGMLGAEAVDILKEAGLDVLTNRSVLILSRAVDTAARHCLLSKKCIKRTRKLIAVMKTP